MEKKNQEEDIIHLHQKILTIQTHFLQIYGNFIHYI
jgi:hypothetical protein